MLGSHVRRQCRARLNPQRAPSKTPQWQPRATLISFRKAQPQPQPQPQNTAEQPETPTQPDEPNPVPEPRQRPTYDLFDRSNIQPEPSHPSRVSRYSRYIREDTEDAPETPAAAPRNERRDVESEPHDYTAIVLSSLGSHGVKVGWQKFDQIYTSADCEALTKPSTLDIQHINEKRFFGQVLHQVFTRFCEGRGEPSVTPTTALFKYEQLGVAPPGLWIKHVIEPLTYQVVLAANGATTKLRRDLPSLLSELISVWRLFFQCKGVANKRLDAVSPEWNLPTVDALPKVFQDVDFIYRLQELHPRALGSSELGFCAIYMFILSDAIASNESLRQQAAPFQDVLVRLLAGSRVNAVLKHPTFSKAFQHLPEEVQVEIIREVESAPLKALSAVGRLPHGSGEASRKFDLKSTGQATTDLESFNLKTINRAIEAKASPVVLEKNWKRIVRDYTKDGKTAIPASIYNAFLSGYLILRQAPRSVEVWNHMIQNGVRPELPTWVAMLEGCEKAKDLEGFNAMWQRMQSAGIEPDNYAWTTRVHGLMSFRQYHAGLTALDKMGRRWRLAENTVHAPSANSKNPKGAKNPSKSTKMVNNRTKPTVEVVNGAMSGIVQSARMQPQKRMEYVHKILKWGLQFGIQPDTRTYNILVKLYLDAGETATASKVLQQMEAKGIQADIATHTMLVDAAFGNGSLDDLSEPDRANRLIQIFESLEAGGLRLNDFIYAMAIDRLLKQYGSHSAAHTLVKHMRSRNLFPSAHVYTSLVTHYFQESPPDIAAVDALLQHIFDSPHTDSDKTFFDRVLEGYATYAEIGKMMSVLTRMSKLGHHPSFRALTTVIKALVEAGDADRARFIVRDVRRGEGIATGGVTGAFNDESHFLRIADQLGLVPGSEGERMGDVFRMREGMRVLDEQIEGSILEERSRADQGQSQSQSQSQTLTESVEPEAEESFKQEDWGVPVQEISVQEEKVSVQEEIPFPVIDVSVEEITEKTTTATKEADLGPVEEDVHGFLTNEDKEAPPR
jgi:pentatricopeptide repeat protein